MRNVTKTLVASAAAIALAAAALTTASAGPRKSAPLKGEGKNMKIVANIPYAGGTDMEFATIKGHDYAFAAAAPGVGGAKTGGLHVINIDNPEKPKLATTVPCGLYQGDVQISWDQKTALLAANSAAGPEGCQLVGKTGFLTIDITNPPKAKAIGAGEMPNNIAAHNITAHPTKPYVYVSRSTSSTTGPIDIFSIKNPAKPKYITAWQGIPASPHDISFNKDGSLAVTASINHFDLFDMSDPENPQILFSGQCPGCSITHDAKFTPDGKKIVIGDEGGGGGGYPCPGGALYFYDLQANRVPVLTGVYEPNEVLFARDGQTGLGACTSHVFDISDDSSKIAISWYSAGSRYLDISNSQGPTFGDQGTGVKELGWFMPEDGVSWSSKFYKGPYIYSNDEHRGFDVFKILKP